MNLWLLPGGKGQLESAMDMYTLLYLRWMINKLLLYSTGFPGGSDGKEGACTEGDQGLIPGLGRSPGEGNVNPFQYSCLQNSKKRGAWCATVDGFAKSWTQLSNQHFLLNSTGNSAQSYVAAWMGDEFGGEWVNVYV